MRKRNLFNLSNQRNFSCDPGYLIPIDWWEVVPGDTFQCNTSMLIRSTPLNAPVMHPLIVRINWWYVSQRLIWDDFEDFHTGGPDGTSTPTHPYIALGSVSESTLYDYLGLPVDTYGATINVNALPIRAFNLIWNEHYRDQDLATERTIDTTSGADTTSDVTMAKVAWPKDYYTTARGFKQRGTAISIPLTGDAPVTGIGTNAASAAGPTAVYETDASASRNYANYWVTGTHAHVIEEDPSNSGYPNIRADLSSVSGVSIDDFRENMALQKFMEDMAKSGSRYGEYLRMMVGIRGSDARLQIPSYCGGGKQVIQFSEVLSTDDGGTNPVGTLRGHGIGAMQSNRFRRFFEEHGILMATMSVTPKPMYMNGIERKWSRTAKEDYYQQQLAKIGEQELLNQELYAAHGTPGGTFGYVPRYDEYRTQNSGVAGELNSTLNHYHFARDFGSAPSLNETFVECTPTTRCHASTSTHKFICAAHNRVAARRPMDRRAITRLVG
jgi:hypothetical protein